MSDQSPVLAGVEQFDPLAGLPEREPFGDERDAEVARLSKAGPARYAPGSGNVVLDALAGSYPAEVLAELLFSPLQSYIDGLIVEGFGIIDGKSAAFQHRSRARELSVDMRSGAMGMDEMRDAFGEVTWHQAQARRWRSENDS
jgi:hypothetical protein